MPGRVIEIDRRDQALEEACRRVGLDPVGAELLRRGTNSVYRLASAPVIVRVAPAGAPVEGVQRQVAVARWLAREGVPAVRVLDVAQPVEAVGHLVTLWESISDDGGADDLDQYGTTRELGTILRQLHQLVPPTDVRLSPGARFPGGAEQLAGLGHVSDEDRAFLAERAARLEHQHAELRFELPEGPIHGDASVGNLLRDRSGHPVLSDLDNFRWGHREWDLVLTAMFWDLYGWHTEVEYRDFADAYGYDVRAWDGYPVIRDIRELSMVLWVAGNAVKDEEAADELQIRLASLRTGAGRERWRPL